LSVASGPATTYERVAHEHFLNWILGRRELLLNLLFAFVSEALRWPRRIWVSP
jgi:hypothetical protein